MQKNRTTELHQALRQRVLVLDGAMGTAIQQKNLTPQDFGGEELEGCNENLVLTKPEVIQEIHEAYLETGADIIETNTFGATPLVLDEYNLGSKAHEINLKAAQLAREAADKFSTPEKPRWVAGSIGPTTKAISVTGGVTFDELYQNFYAQASSLLEGGVDYFLIETCQDTRNVKAAILAVQDLLKKEKVNLPIAVSITIEPMGTMLAGQGVEALVTSLEQVDLLYVGMNCATGPEFMTDHLRTLAALAPWPTACVPNAGLPDEEGRYLETPAMITAALKEFGEAGWINLVGGCCGTTPEYIKSLAKMAKELSPRKIPPLTGSALSGIDYLEITDEKRPVMVGERTNVIGSRKFKRLIVEEKFEEASEVARTQVKNGAEIIDICLANPDQDEYQDMENFLRHVIQKVKVPLMIDSTDEKVTEMALPYSQGKAIINSINLEDGEERFEKIAPLAKRFGAALVVGTIDEDKVQGMGVTRERKLEIATRSYKILTEQYGIRGEDIYFDPLVFPVGTGDEQYKGSGVETIEGIKLIKEKFPQCKTVLGISNVSFGLPPAGREVLNSVFLHHCIQSGLDLALVNTEKLERYPSIPEEEKKLAEDLIWNRGEDPIQTFTEHFRGATTRVKETKSNLNLDERLANYIIEGSKEGLVEDLELKLKEAEPLKIINGPLMAGMDEVGRLFNNNELIVAEVLQSAEAMKAAVAHLEPMMEKSESSSRGKVILATVKGDVHDIGKNLVDIILSNNGFTVINLGIKIPPEQLIAAIEEHQPDIVGLSGLLVKSAQQMVITAEDLKSHGINKPILVGGAALSQKFTDKKIARAYEGFVTYASDAMNGLDLVKQIQNPQLFAELKKTVTERQSTVHKDADYVELELPKKTSQERSNAVEVLPEVPQPPDWERHSLTNTPVEQIWKFLNPLMLYSRHLGLKGKHAKLLAQGKLKEVEALEGGPKAVQIWEAVQELKEECKTLLKPKAVYQFFPAYAEGNRIQILEASAQKIIGAWDLPRQTKDKHLCLADYLQSPPQWQKEKPDNLALFVVTAGREYLDLSRQFKEKGEYLKSHALAALALETAEAYAEYLHSRLRSAWGFADPLDMQMIERFQAKYRGKRYSFGYPACPDLAGQTELWKLLKPQDIGVELTEGYMMEPEASVSALVFHHSQAEYFGVQG